MVKCPRCKKEISELDEKCKYCGLDFANYEQKMQSQENYEKEEEQGYVTGYNVFLAILAILLFIGGLIIGQEEINIMLTFWIAGIILLVIMI